MTSVQANPAQPPGWLAIPSGAATGPFTAALVVAGLLHLLLIGGVSLAPPVPRPAPETALEILILKETWPATAHPSPEAALAQRDQAGESARGAAAISTFADSEPAPEADGSSEDAPEPPEEPVTKPESQKPPQPLDVSPPEDPLARPDAMTMPPTAPPTAPVLAADSDVVPLPVTDPLAPRQTIVDAASILASQGQEIARLTASLEARSSAYAKRVRRKSVSASTREFRYASYLSAWAQKVERIGNVNYPQAAKDQRLYGSLILHVSVRSDGSVERIRVVRSSGVDLLDQAAVQIVELAAPFSPFPADIAAETDVLDIIRTWQFMRGDVLGWER
ncbi:energy transducer TonB [Thiocystis violacea]|uniref:energy transducer TonB n=1 Tax=Thiocystis violacea TaxID=13725 RepID=UPI001903B19F|nr:energy transducer TonB [Thiocystis violacea]MBK1716149.1 energy transducer TonB [Thiocystis violacea]